MVRVIFCVIGLVMLSPDLVSAREKMLEVPDSRTLEQIQADFAADKKCVSDDRAKRIEIYTATLQCVHRAEDWLALGACQREENEKLVSSVAKCKSSAKKPKKH